MIDAFVAWLHKHAEETLWLIVVGIVAIRIDVLLAHIAATLDRLARELRNRAASTNVED